MDVRANAFNALEAIVDLLENSLEQLGLGGGDEPAAPEQPAAQQSATGFQERSLLDGNVHQARFSAAQNTNRAAATSNVTATSSAAELARDPRVRAMLDVLGFTEGTGNNYGKVVNGRVLSSPNNPGLVGQRNVSVTDFSRHPNALVQVRPGLNSTAAGRYQFLNSTWNSLGMPDFSPQSQDIAAVKLMQRRGMIEPLLRGDIQTAIFRGAPEWASLPKNASNQGYYSGQSARTLNDITNVYNNSLRRHQNGQGAAPASGNQSPMTPNPPTNATNQAAPTNSAQPAANIGGGTLRRGMRGENVKELQKELVRLGFMTQAEMNTGPGVFGPRTQRALRAFQAANNIAVDGVFGSQSRRALQNAAPVAQTPQTNQPNQPKTPGGPNGANPAQPAEPVNNGNAPTYQPYSLFSSGAGSVRRVTGYDQLQPHHDYQHVTRGGQRLEVRDVVLTRPGQNNNGQTVPSPLEGRVVAAGVRGGYGNAVEVVNDRTGERFLIGHLSRINVRVGQQIGYGQSIGAQGSTGHSTGPHVHIESQSNVIRRWVADLVDGKFDGR